jgi:hypothetical protein
MIKIIKTEVECDLPHFKKELRSFTEKYIKHNPSVFAITLQALNSHFGTKLKLMEFYTLSEDLGFRVWNGKAWLVNEILN